MKTKITYVRTVGIILMILLLTAGEIIAQPVIRNRTRKFLNRTSLVIIAAKKELAEGKNYTGDFAKAVAHQKYARKLFIGGFYQRAAFHSHRARMLAFAVIKSNKGTVQREWELNKDESDLPANQPNDQELDKVLFRDNPNLVFDDKVAVQAELKEIDVK